jgi:putative transposase
VVELINEAVEAGARLKKACETVGITLRSYLRWRSGNLVDRRTVVPKVSPRKLSEEEVEAFYREACSERFQSLTPGQIVAALGEEGTWYGSERTLYRILKAKGALQSRTKSRTPVRNRKPKELVATGPNQVWSWDITWLRTDVGGLFYYAYVIIDVFSRKVVGWTIEINESTDHAKALFQRVIRDNKVMPRFVHADNGGPMKGVTLVGFLTRMKVGLTYSRPRVSDDNPFIESFFKTLKYNVRYPKQFTTLATARTWFADFIDWYNTKHRHSGIGYVTPEQRHSGAHLVIHETRAKAKLAAYKLHPERFVHGPRDYTDATTPVVLNKAS